LLIVRLVFSSFAAFLDGSYSLHREYTRLKKHTPIRCRMHAGGCSIHYVLVGMLTCFSVAVSAFGVDDDSEANSAEETASLESVEASTDTADRRALASDSETGSDVDYRRQIQAECREQIVTLELVGKEQADYLRLCLSQYGL
jgi:hypothetical protein